MHDRIAQVIFERCYTFDLIAGAPQEQSSHAGFGSTGR
jgi:dUTPase